MFIAHGEKVRKHSKWILGVVLVLLIPGFIALFTKTGGEDRRAANLPKLNGKELAAGEYLGSVQAVRDLYVVNTGRRPPASAEAEDSIKQEAVIRLLLLREAKKMGLRAAPEAVLDFVRRLPVFRAEGGQFDADRYARYLIYLNNQGISETRFEDLMRDQFLIVQVENAIADGAKVTPQELELSYAPFHEKLWIEMVSFTTTNVTNPPAVSDADAQQEFERSRETYRRPAQVKVRYAHFAFDLAAAAAKVTDPEVLEYYERNRPRFTNALESAKLEIRQDLALIAAQRVAGEQAEAFSIKLVPEKDAPAPDFAKLAGEVGAKVGETGYFAQGDDLESPKAGRGFVQAAFALSYRPEPPYSDPIQGADGFYVLQYVDGKPSRLPEFAEVKAAVVAALVEQRTRDQVGQQARAALDKVRALVKGGKNFAAACAELKLAVESHGPFTYSGRKLEVPGAVRIAQASISMPTNAVSDYLATENGGLFFSLKDRQPYDRAEFEVNKSVLLQELWLRNRQAMFHGWLENLWRENQVDLGRLQSQRNVVPPPEAEPEPQPQPAAAPQS